MARWKNGNVGLEPITLATAETEEVSAGEVRFNYRIERLVPWNDGVILACIRKQFRTFGSENFLINVDDWPALCEWAYYEDASRWDDRVDPPTVPYPTKVLG